MAYIEPDEVLDVLGAPQRRPDPTVVEQFITEAQSRVEGALGVLPDPEPGQRNEEVAGVIRDLAAARAIFVMHAGQTSEVPRQATSLRDDALVRLRDLDARINLVGGVGEVDETAFSNPDDGAKFWTYDDFELIRKEYYGYRDSDPRF